MHTVSVMSSTVFFSSRGKTILKMQHVDFKYPTHEKNTVEDITLTVCMGSRVAVVGANGAGKSTAIKLLIGELKPIQGTIWRHQNMRLAYVRRQSPWQSPDRPRQSPKQSRSQRRRLQVNLRPRQSPVQSPDSPRQSPRQSRSQRRRSQANLRPRQSPVQSPDCPR